jgi:hypothetical protein
MSPWQAFTAGELFNVALGAACTGTAIGYGLHLVHAAPGWWVACAAGLAVAAAASARCQPRRRETHCRGLPGTAVIPIDALQGV